MRILIRLAIRLFEIKNFRSQLLNSNDIRNTICSFLDKKIFGFVKDHIPSNVVNFAFYQFVLYWWAIPQKYKNRLFDMHHRFAGRLEGDLILAAAETAKNIFRAGERSVKARRSLTQGQTITTYHSVKGGTGKSTLAVAHAFALSKECAEDEKVAIIDLDLLNPSLLAMHMFAKIGGGFKFLEQILTSDTRPGIRDMDNAFKSHPKHPNILLGSVFGPGRERDLLSRMLNKDIENWLIVVDNLRAIVDFLIRKEKCRYVILDNSPGFYGLAIPSAIIAAERHGTFVLVSSLDAFDVGNIPQNQASFDHLFHDRRRVLVFNKAPDGIFSKNNFQNSDLVSRLLRNKIIKYIENDPNRVYFDDTIMNECQLRSRLKQIEGIEIEPILAIWRQFTVKDYESCSTHLLARAWQEAMSRAGKHVVDLSSKCIKAGSEPDYDDTEDFLLFINIEAMFNERGQWDISFVKFSKKLARIWHLGSTEQKSPDSWDPDQLLDIEEITHFVKFIINKDQ